MFEWPCIKGEIFTYTITGRYKYLYSNRYAQVFTNNYFFDVVHPMEKKSISGQVLREFISNTGVMDRLVCDGSKEHTSKGTDL